MASFCGSSLLLVSSDQFEILYGKAPDKLCSLSVSKIWMPGTSLAFCLID